MSVKRENSGQAMERAKILRELEDSDLASGIGKAIRRFVQLNSPRIKAGAIEGEDFSSEIHLVVGVAFSEGKRVFNIDVKGRVQSPEMTISTGSKW